MSAARSIAVKRVEGMAMMPWFHRDFLAATQGWTLTETGAYFLLLCAQWEMGPLSNNLLGLASIARCAPKEFKPLWKKLAKKFEETAEGLVNTRLENHRREALRLRDRRRNGAAQTNQKLYGNGAGENHAGQH